MIPFIHFILPVSPVFDDLRASYKNLIGGLRNAGVAVHGPEGELLIADSPAGDVFVCYHRPKLTTLKAPRQGKVLFVYCEPLGPLEGMTGDGLAYLQSFEEIMPLLNGVLVHTPQMRDDLLERMYSDFVTIFPAGLDPDLFPLPTTTIRNIDFLFYGSPAGKRQWALEALKSKLGDRLVIAPQGTYGDELTKLLHRTKVTVYVAHSDVRSFSTWRMWRDSLAGCAMAIECLDGNKADAWPLTNMWDHYPLPRLEKTEESVADYVDRLNLIDDKYNSNYALRARAIAQRMTTRRCVEDFLLPFIEKLTK